MPDYGFLGQGVGLGRVLVAWWLVGEGLDEFVGEDLDVCPLVRVLLDLDWLLLCVEVPSGLLLDWLGVLYVFQGHKGSVSVAAEDSFVPHQIVVDQLA